MNSGKNLQFFCSHLPLAHSQRMSVKCIRAARKFAATSTQGGMDNAWKTATLHSTVYILTQSMKATYHGKHSGRTDNA